MTNSQAHVDWILGEGRMQGLQHLVTGLGARLRADGFPIMRLRAGIRTTHPLTAALSYIWESEGGQNIQRAASQGLETRSTYIGSPLEIIARTGAPLRRRLTGALGPDDHSVLHELKANGGTDYYGLPLFFATGSGGIIAVVSDAPEGFSDADIALIDALCPALSTVAEIYSNRHLATAIATSYLGQRTGQRVLDGQITRGDIETLEAAILFSDIRGWTALNATRPAAETLAIANRYFEVISEAVDGCDGEILKFMGDGVLALFPGDAGRREACRSAVSAASKALSLARETELPVPFGIGIHYGEVLYGNVGAHSRIDFTVLGQSVNTAARIEALTAQSGHPVLVSDAVADSADVDMDHVGTEMLKGLSAPMAVYAPVNS